MKFKIDSQIIEKFPGVNIGLVIVKGIDNAGKNEEINQVLRSAEAEARSKLQLESLTTNPRIDAWRKAYASFGSKPKTYKNSVEALLRRVLKNDELPDISKIVNIYNLMSLKHIVPAGGDDIDHIEGDIRLTIAQGGEPFTLLGNRQKETAEPGEVIYRDDKEVLCRRWNWRECDKSKMTEETKNVTLVVEGLPPVTKEEIDQIIKELAELVQKYCGGEAKTVILNKENPEVEI
ncbi:hypothetical protein KY310_03080 [Candidatus Woesearchaeota archaeon]|nr:hypothetical protein [Candidatus Woesearchaeota archaeon]